MKRSSEILKQIWGYDSFRPLQEDIVDASINGKDVLALLPTGGGKSICFQVPGMAREGICIVVSPLIALMQDQVNQLVKRGVRARALTSGISYREMDITLDNARFGGLDFLYVSPERLQTKLFQERLKLMSVGLFVVDEAHCISEWGHDFRPSYRLIPLLREIHPKVPIMALTATATAPVKEDIIANLQLENTSVFEDSFERKNVSYEVYPVTNKSQSIVNLCHQHKDKVGIVYCQTRRSVKEMTKLLLSQGLAVNMYHGGLDNQQRADALNKWLSEETPIMVATNAFGMGIDKPNVRFVTHYEIPNNPEAYFQEAGRAGRDGDFSRTFAFIESKDFGFLQQRIDSQFPSIDEIKHVYRALCNYLKIAIGSGNGETYPVSFASFTNRFELNATTVYSAFKILEMNGDIVFSEHSFHGSRLKFTVDNKHVYSFQIGHPKLDSLITRLCRNHSSIFEQFEEIREYELCKQLKISFQELNKQLHFLEEQGIIDVNWRTSDPTVTFLHERFPDDYITLKPEKYTFRKERAYERLDAIKTIMTATHCRSVQLLDYFGQQVKPCGVCDVCLAQRKDEKVLELEARLFQILETPKTVEEILQEVEPVSHVQLKNMLKDLILQERINVIDGKLSLK